MGSLVFFPTERYGAVCRATEQPHPVERLAAWIRKAAHIRASASLGCEASLELAPNIVPMCKRPHTLTNVERAVKDYGKLIGLGPDEIGRCMVLAANARRSGDSEATAVQTGKRLATKLAWGCESDPKGAA